MSILIKKGDVSYANVNYIEAYIPDSYYEKNLVEEQGELINIFGVFNFAVGNKDGQVTKDIKLFNFPMFMGTRPALIEKKELSIRPNGKPQLYHIYKYYKGDVFINNNNIIKNLKNTDRFIDLVNAGKLPDGIPYDNLLNIYLNNLTINDMDLGIPSKIIEFKLSEICRDKKNPEIPFRKTINNGKVSDTDYIQLNLRNIAMMSSVFSAITFEDIDTMVISSVNKKRYNRDEFESPVEKIIKY